MKNQPFLKKKLNVEIIYVDDGYKVRTVEEVKRLREKAGSSVCKCLSEKNFVFVHKIGINDYLGESGTVEELVDKYRISSKKIYKQIKSFCNQSVYKTMDFS